MPVAIEMSGRAVIVTGGCRGIGAGIAERFLTAGADVVICCRHEPETLPAGPDGRTASFVAADVRQPEEVERVVRRTTGSFGRLDVLVNNAGGSPPSDAATTSYRFASSVVALNLLAPFEFSRQVNEVMQEQDQGGSIVNIGSVSGLRPSPTAAMYGAAKAGLVSLTQTLAVEWAPKVRVNTVSAGMVRTELSHVYYGDEEGVEAVGRTVPLGRLGEPADVADACLYLASDLARYVSGANLVLHGGGERPSYLDATRSS
jgi:NAD(P)-dependent dehydrogenase (short-subunit alcohol dehydrogenase family)